ncbi:hypothetical protein F4861DRAFT_525650 [Xylaria intraflava]|nr:hypothetical protein F4861DRAFT_525650 [Xylaria intraflava]
MLPTWLAAIPFGLMTECNRGFPCVVYWAHGLDCWVRIYSLISFLILGNDGEVVSFIPHVDSWRRLMEYTLRAATQAAASSERAIELARNDDTVVTKQDISLAARRTM